jgi:hypothetical protein
MILDGLLGLLFVGGTVAVTLGAYFLMRLAVRHDAERDKELAASVLTRIAALHALILALVFAQEMVDYQQLRLEGATETNAIADIYNDAKRYDPVLGQPIREDVSDYLNVVIRDEWSTLAVQRRLDPAAWALWENIYEYVLDLEPTTERQRGLREHMLEKVHDISEQRTKREMIGQDSLGAFFWFAATSGLIFSAVAFYPFAPEPRSLLLLSLYGGFTGVVLFMIFAFSNPYRAPGFLPPGAFERLQQHIKSDAGLLPE